MSPFLLAIVLRLSLVLGSGLMSGACGAPLAVTAAGYAADGGLLVASDKTASDHFMSMVSRKDCAMWRLVRGRSICKDREGDKDPYDVDYVQPQRTVAEDGVRYAPPLHAAADAPATSWEATAYKPVPAPAAPNAPVTAVAEAPPDRTPPAATTLKAKKTKAKSARSIKKPSRDPAAPPS
jgi:hypothetical protein